MGERPLGVTIIAIVVMISGIVSVCSGIVGFGAFGFETLGSLFGAGGPDFWAPVSSGVNTLWGLFMIIFGYGLWSMKEWARFATVALIGLYLVWQVIRIFAPGPVNWFSFVVGVIVVIYLSRQQTRELFY